MFKNKINGYATGELTRQRLIKAGGELAAEYGIDNLSIRAIAKKAGENIGTIQYHFGSKDGYINAIFEYAIAPLIQHSLTERMSSYLENLNTPEGQSKAIWAYVNYHVNHMFRRKREYWTVTVLFNIMRTNHRLSGDFYNRIIEHNEEILRMILKKSNPELNDTDMFIYSRTILSPLIIHTNCNEYIQGLLRAEDYPSDYIDKLEQIIVKQNLLSLKLPLLENYEN